jgi:hypothetical protein
MIPKSRNRFSDQIMRRLHEEASMATANRRIVWLNVVTVISAAILIGAEVFGAAFAGSWALATLFDLGGIGQRILDGVFVLCGIAIMAQFIRAAHRIEPFTARS